MAREYFCAYHSYIEAMEPLNDAEKGRLFTALLIYSSTGEAPQLSGNERFIFPGLKSQIDRDAKKYSDFAAKQAENGRKGGRPPKANKSQKTQPFLEKPKKAKEKEKEKEKENISPPLSPSLGDCGPELNEAFSDWLAYKAEKRQGYKPTGLKALIARVESAAKEHGEKAVADLIRDSMAANWQGIAFDRLKAAKTNPPEVPKAQKAPQGRLVKLETGEEVVVYE